jgi:hypothetical protein
MVRDSERAPLAGPATEKRKEKYSTKFNRKRMQFVCLFVYFLHSLYCYYAFS